MSAKPVKVTWIHSDKRGKQSYSSITEFTFALNVQYSTAWKYINKGYKGDRDLKKVDCPPMKLTRPTKNTNQRLKMLRKAMERNGISQ